MLVPVLVGAGIGAGASLIGQGAANIGNGESLFHGISLSSIVMSGLAGAAFATGLGGFLGAIGIGALSNAGMSSLEKNSWANIGLSFAVGGASAAIGFGLKTILTELVFKGGMTFTDYFELGLLDTGIASSAFQAFLSSWYTFLPSFVPGIAKGLIKFLGNRGISWL